MNATILPNSEKHYPVLLDEILSIISPQNGGTFIDCTFGQGGYSRSILKFNNTNVIALDRDPDCKSIAKKFKELNKERFLFYNKKFSNVNQIKKSNSKIKAIIFDLGYSYSQIKNPNKGLSFESKGNLNMKLGLNDFSAKSNLLSISLLIHEGALILCINKRLPEAVQVLSMIFNKEPLCSPEVLYIISKDFKLELSICM